MPVTRKSLADSVPTPATSCTLNVIVRMPSTGTALVFTYGTARTASWYWAGDAAFFKVTVPLVAFHVARTGLLGITANCSLSLPFTSPAEILTVASVITPSTAEPMRTPESTATATDGSGTDSVKLVMPGVVTTS